MTSKTSYQECGNQSLLAIVQFDPTGLYLLIPTIIGIKVMEWSTNKCRKVIGKGDASTLRFLGGCLCLGDAKVDKQILLARVADSAMGGSANGSDGGKENDPLSDSIFITTAFNKRRFYIFSHKDDPIALADEEHGDGEVQQQATISRDILNEPPDSDDLLLNHHTGGTNKEESALGKEAISQMMHRVRMKRIGIPHLDGIRILEKSK
jgi:hypothetical protein